MVPVGIVDLPRDTSIVYKHVDVLLLCGQSLVDGLATVFGADITRDGDNLAGGLGLYIGKVVDSALQSLGATAGDVYLGAIGIKALSDGCNMSVAH